MDELIGQELSGFRFKKILGRGAMGQVYLAEQISLRRLVAVKLIASEASENTKIRLRFVRELRVQMRLSHPHLVRVIDAGLIGEHRYIALEYVAGGTLADWMEPGAVIPLDETLSTLIGLLDGLDYLHQEGIIHRDLKPANVLFSGDGIAKIADFGLAFSREMTLLTAHNQFVGSLRYLPPEVLQKERAGSPGDVYAMGFMAYTLLTGRHPYLGETPQAFFGQVMNVIPDPPSQVRGDIPESISDIVQAMLTKDPRARISAGEARDRLRDVVDLRASDPSLDAFGTSDRPSSEGWVGSAALTLNALVAIVKKWACCRPGGLSIFLSLLVCFALTAAITAWIVSPSEVVGVQASPDPAVLPRPHPRIEAISFGQSSDQIAVWLAGSGISGSWLQLTPETLRPGDAPMDRTPITTTPFYHAFVALDTDRGYRLSLGYKEESGVRGFVGLRTRERVDDQRQIDSFAGALQQMDRMKGLRRGISVGGVADDSALLDGGVAGLDVVAERPSLALVPGLIRMLDHPSLQDSHLDRIVRIAHRLKHPVLLDHMLKFLTPSVNSYTRAKGIAALLDSRHLEASSCRSSLWPQGNHISIERLAPQIRDHPDRRLYDSLKEASRDRSNLYSELLEAMAACDPGQSLVDFEIWAQDSDPHIRERGLLGLGVHGSMESLAKLLNFQSQEIPEIPAELLPTLLEALTWYPEPGAQRAAAEVFEHLTTMPFAVLIAGTLPSPRVGEILENIVLSPDRSSDLRAAATIVLAQRSGPRAARVLESLLVRSEDTVLLEAACWGLGWLSVRRVADRIALLRTQHGDLVDVTSWALARMGDRRALDRTPDSSESGIALRRWMEEALGDAEAQHPQGRELLNPGELIRESIVIFPFVRRLELPWTFLPDQGALVEGVRWFSGEANPCHEPGGQFFRRTPFQVSLGPRLHDVQSDPTWLQGCPDRKPVVHFFGYSHGCRESELTRVLGFGMLKFSGFDAFGIGTQVTRSSDLSLSSDLEPAQEAIDTIRDLLGEYRDRVHEAYRESGLVFPLQGASAEVLYPEGHDVRPLEEALTRTAHLIAGESKKKRVGPWWLRLSPLVDNLIVECYRSRGLISRGFLREPLERFKAILRKLDKDPFQKMFATLTIAHLDQFEGGMIFIRTGRARTARSIQAQLMGQMERWSGSAEGFWWIVRLDDQMLEILEEGVIEVLTSVKEGGQRADLMRHFAADLGERVPEFDSLAREDLTWEQRNWTWWALFHGLSASLIGDEDRPLTEQRRRDLLGFLDGSVFPPSAVRPLAILRQDFERLIERFGSLGEDAVVSRLISLQTRFARASTRK